MLKHKCMCNSLYIIYLFILCTFVNGSILDYFPLVGKSLFGSDNENEHSNELSMQKVPYEVEVTDEKFIEQAAKFTGVSLSDLDKCQHRVVFKLQTECHKLNDEELAKLAVKLLNCQSAIEGRTVYPCTDAMPIRDCTSKMDPDTWNSYLLMSNRARAVCYSIRQAQFRGLTEMTVNKLMGAAHEQLSLMTRLSSSQARVESATASAFNQVKKDTEILNQQQKDLQRAQLHGQLTLEDNIRRLTDEKQLIISGHEQLTSMTEKVQKKLDEAADQLDKQSSERKNNHKEILQDLIKIQTQTREIFSRIEQSSKDLYNTQKTFTDYYKSTINHLSEINSTISLLGRQIKFLGETFNQNIFWLGEALGGTDDALERLSSVVQHAIFLVLGMVSCAFLQIDKIGRIALLVIVPGNLCLKFWELNYLGIGELLMATVGFIVFQALLNFALNFYHTRKPLQSIEPKKEIIDSETEEKDTFNDSFTNRQEITSSKRFEFDDFEFTNPTPPLSRLSRSRSKTPSRNGLDRAKCSAMTRLGTPCKSTALLGRDFCHRHQKGSSVVLE